MLSFRRRILGRSTTKAEGAVSPEAVEVRSAICEVVAAETGHGRARAINGIARATGLTERRVTAIMRAEVKRIWADELRAIREWHSAWSEQQAAQLRHKAAMLEARTKARRSSYDETAK